MTLPEDRLTEQETAERAGTTVERIRELVALGLLQPEGGMFRRRDVLRARVIGGLSRTGIDAAALSKASAAGELSFGHLESAGRRHPRADITFEEFGEEMGIGYGTLEAIFIALGLPQPRRDERVRQEDVEGLKALPALFGAGVSEGQVLQMARVWGDGARRIAQYQSHYMHAVIEEPFRRRGLRDNEAFEEAFRYVEPAGFRLERVGIFELKGIARPIAIYEATEADVDRRPASIPG